MKITGATQDPPKDIPSGQQQRPVLPASASSATEKGAGKAAGVMPQEAVTAGTDASGAVQDEPKDPLESAVLSPDDLALTGASTPCDDGDFLDLLTETLDGEFDPSLFV